MRERRRKKKGKGKRGRQVEVAGLLKRYKYKNTRQRVKQGREVKGRPVQ